MVLPVVPPDKASPVNPAFVFRATEVTVAEVFTKRGVPSSLEIATGVEAVKCKTKNSNRTSTVEAAGTTRRTTTFRRWVDEVVRVGFIARMALG